MAEKRKDRLRRGWIQTRGRFVRQQVRGSQGERTCDPDPLLLAAGELCGPMPAVIAETDPVKQLGNPLLFGAVGGSEILERQRDILSDSPTSQQRRGLEDDADTATRSEEL